MPASKDKRYTLVPAQQLCATVKILQTSMLTRCLGHNKHHATDDDSGNCATTEPHCFFRSETGSRVCARVLAIWVYGKTTLHDDCKLPNVLANKLAEVSAVTQDSTSSRKTRSMMLLLQSRRCEKSRNSQDYCNWLPAAENNRTRQTPCV